LPTFGLDSAIHFQIKDKYSKVYESSRKWPTERNLHAHY
jgi:hypothetical protein